MSDLISRQAAMDTLKMDYTIIPYTKAREYVKATLDEIWDRLDKLPSVQPEPSQVARDIATIIENEMDMRVILSAHPEQRYTEEELRVFLHGISLSLLSKRSAQRWRYDEDTAKEIEFLERLYEKVGADMRGEQK